MLRALSLRNFVLIARADLELGPGLTVLTGETGAGKTLLTQALELLLGERASDDLIGPDGDEARVEAVFDLGGDQVSLISAEIAELAGIEPGQLVATRRLIRGGRNRCYLNETACTLTGLGSALRPLLAFSGQHEHRRLLEPAYQREVLDSLGGEPLASAVAEYRQVWGSARQTAARLEAARQNREERERERSLLEFQVAELEAAALSEEEEAELLLEQRRLAKAEEILRVCTEAAELLRAEHGEGDAVTTALESARLIDRVSDVDPRLADIGANVVEAANLLQETARDLRAFRDGVEIDPERLEQVEERLRTYVEMARKYGGTTASAIEFYREAAERLFVLVGEEEDLTTMEERYQRAREAAEQKAKDVSALRLATAPLLEEEIARELADLGMAQTSVKVAVKTTAAWEDLGPFGADTVDFQMAPNPGLPPRSLRKVASGGELSRTLLAIKAAVAGLESSETLVFDEIDAGIGGRTATAVGAKLRTLARENQLLVISHQPQVAAFADNHILIEKLTESRSSGTTTVTRLRNLSEAEALDELCRMMGAEPGDRGALEHARRLRDRAAAGLVD